MRKPKTVNSAAALERRLARAFLRMNARIRAKVLINDIALALAGKNVRDADDIIRRLDVDDALQPAATIVKDAFDKGGRIGAEQVNELQDAA